MGQNLRTAASPSWSMFQKNQSYLIFGTFPNAESPRMWNFEIPMTSYGFHEIFSSRLPSCDAQISQTNSRVSEL